MAVSVEEFNLTVEQFALANIIEEQIDKKLTCAEFVLQDDNKYHIDLDLDYEPDAVVIRTVHRRFMRADWFNCYFHGKKVLLTR